MKLNTMLVEFLIVAFAGAVISLLMFTGCINCFNALTADLKAQQAQIEEQQKEIDLLKEVIDLD